MTISVVIPVFNEESTIGGCLDLLALHGEHLEEVIVVNNCSTDRTADIVLEKKKLFRDLRIIDEPHPGVIPARNAGINAATGTIVARIDADTRVQPGWAAALVDFFAETGDEFGAAMGPFNQYDMPLQGIHKFLMKVAARSGNSEASYSEAFGVYGANMAVRKSVWETIRSGLHDEPNLWEDLDISLALKAAGIKSALVKGMKVEVSGRRMLTSRKLYWEFTAANRRTWQLNGNTSKLLWINVWVARIFYLVFWVPSRTFDPSTRKHSVRKLFADREDRPIA